MGAREYWDRMLVYFGIADEADVEDRPSNTTSSSSRPINRRQRETDEWDELVDDRPARKSRGRGAAAGGARSVSETKAGVGIVPPKTFNDAQAIADHFKRGVPVIVNLQQTDGELSKRLIDFASGLTYGLDGAMSRIADKVFLLTPPNVDVSAEDRAAILEGGFFNQS